MPDSPTDTLTPPLPRPRFSWPMRLFLGVIVFDMVFHSFAALFPYRDWCKGYQIDTLPLGLPDPEERAALDRAQPEANHRLLTERVMSSFDSPCQFWKPCPATESRTKMS